MGKQTDGRQSRNASPWALTQAAIIALSVSLSSYGLTVSVAEFRLEADAGGELAAAFVVRNDGASPIDLSILVSDWDDGPDGVTRLRPLGEDERSCGRWISSAPTFLSLSPLEERAVGFTVSIPPGVRGTYWTGLVLREVGRAAPVSSEVLIRLFVTAPPAEPQAAVTGLSAVETSPLRVAVRIANKGNVRLCDVQGLVLIDGPLGELASFALPPFHLLPGHERWLEAAAAWGLDLPGVYLVRVVFDYGAEVLVAGQVVVRIP